MNPLAPKVKKKKETYSETYRQGTIATNRDQICAYVKRADFVFINRQSIYDNGNQSLQITIEINSETAKKLDASNINQ
jgi:hypothetical protein